MKVGNFFRNIFLNIKILWHSLFVGMKSADEKTMGMTKEGEITDNAIEEHISEEGVYADLLRGELTQEVMELRDSNYRGYKGSFDYKYIGNGNVTKKSNMASPKLNLYNPESLKILLVQDNKLIVDGIVDATGSAEKEGDEVQNRNSNFTMNIERDVFPKFLIEKYVNKIVVRENGNKFKIDLYCSVYAGQFSPTDALFINEMRNILEDKVKYKDTVLIDSFEFITDSCYGAKDITFYKFGELQYNGIVLYDGNFVVTYDGVAICNGLDLTEQYRTEEMDRKYANKEMREGAVITLDLSDKEEFDVDTAINLLKEYNTYDN